MKNPVILASHQHRLNDGESPVIGKVVSWSQKGKETICVIEFADTPLGLRYWTLYNGKYQQAFSIGFNSNPEKRERRNINGKIIVVHTEIELYEISAVSVPSNREALSKAAKRKQDFINAKRGCPADTESYYSGDDVLNYVDDYFAGRLDGIPEKALSELKRLDQEVEKTPDDNPFGFDFSENASGCPTNEDYLEAAGLSDEAGIDSQGVAGKAFEPDYAALFK